VRIDDTPGITEEVQEMKHEEQPVVVDSGFRALQNISDTKQERVNQDVN
jgi:hypothetical protein